MTSPTTVPIARTPSRRRVPTTRASRAVRFQSILCPVDFSPDSRVALRYADALARRFGGHLTMSYVNDPLLVAATAIAYGEKELAKQSAIELERLVKHTLRSPRTPTDAVSYIVSSGKAPKEILKAANRVRADVIVMGTRGLTGARRLTLGSTTEAVLRQTTVPVLAVPSVPLTSSVPRNWPGERIVVAVDLHASSLRLLSLAARIADGFGVRLLAAHVLPGVSAPPWLEGTLSAHDRVRVAKAEAALKEMASRLPAGSRPEVRVLCGDIADELSAVVADEHAGLLITLLNPRRTWFNRRRGSISYDVLSHAAAPVLALPR